MPHVFQRYPRSILVLTVFIVGTFLYLQGPYSSHVDPSTFIGLPSDPSLSSRVARAERTYQQVVEKRKALIQKHGPSPTQVVM